ncbi:MAG: lasso peptide biosynthesis B2 protein [Sphingopyxis sp.]|nr:lasso peptide biosynthesis B2 protein [Sphingopyxis sp.]
MAYRLRDGLHFCVSEGRTIFFDVPGDRYFALKPEWDRAFQTFLQDERPVPELAELERARILIHCDGACAPIRPAAIDRANRDLCIEPSSPFIRHAMRSILCQLRAVMWLRLSSFEVIINRIAMRHPATSVSRAEDFFALSQAFAATAPLRPRHRHCLSSSIAYVDMVRASGMEATLVMGVSAQPFSAHCWVQSGDTVLNDRLENIRPFQPIFCV